MNVTLILLALLLGSPSEPAAIPAVPQDTQVGQASQAPSADALVATFTKYQIAIIKKGSAWTKDAPAKIEKLMADRGDYWKKMVDEGKLLGVARVVDPKDVLGIVFFKVQDKDEMKKIDTDAPAVKAKLLTMDIRTVWGSTGVGAGAKDVVKNELSKTEGETYYLVAMTKGPKWSQKADAPETRQATADGMKYLYQLYKQGNLRWVGAFEDMSLKLRNVMILKSGSKDEATIEALGCGTPVIAWRNGAVPEVLDHGLTGFVVDNLSDAVRAVRAIGSIDRNTCRAAFEERFEASRMANRYPRAGRCHRSDSGCSAKGAWRLACGARSVAARRSLGVARLQRGRGGRPDEPPFCEAPPGDGDGRSLGVPPQAGRPGGNYL